MENIVSNTLRRFIRASECTYSDGTWTVHVGLFFEEANTELSFHSRPDDWTDGHVDEYRRAYGLKHTIPGVVQIGREIFSRALLPTPYLAADPTDVPQYRHLHCSWPRPPQQRADQMAAVTTQAIFDRAGARVVHAKAKIKD